MVRLADVISSDSSIELIIAFPYTKEVAGKVNNIEYYSFIPDNKHVNIGMCGSSGERAKAIISNTLPDVIHVFGTEFKHSYVFSRISQELGYDDRLVISIQGLTSIYAKHYTDYLPENVVRKNTIRDFIKGNIKAGKNNYINRGTFEKAALNIASKVIGRTDWDRECTYLINPNRKYYYNSEMLRDSFYRSRKWDRDTCISHRIFMSQSIIPYKGLHIMLEALSQLKKDYPDVCLCVAGFNLFMKKWWKRSYYEEYILHLLKKYNLFKNIDFLGPLDEQQMCEEYLKSHVFVSASSIENSSNSICEAMYLGIPVVSSYVGGVSNLINHGENGFLFQADAPYMLSYYIKSIFEVDKVARDVSLNAISVAEFRHNPQQIYSDLVNIYREISKGND